MKTVLTGLADFETSVGIKFDNLEKLKIVYFPHFESGPRLTVEWLEEDVTMGYVIELGHDECHGPYIILPE